MSEIKIIKMTQRRIVMVKTLMTMLRMSDSLGRRRKTRTKTEEPIAAALEHEGSVTSSTLYFNLRNVAKSIAIKLISQKLH